MNNLNPESNIMPVDDDTAHDIKWVFIWALTFIVTFFTVLYILGKVYPPAEMGRKWDDTLYIRIHPHNLWFWGEDLDSTEKLLQHYTDTVQLWQNVDTLLMDADTVQSFEMPKDFRYWRFDDFDTPHEITYPEPEPKIIKIQRRIKNARNTGIQWK